MMECLCCNLKAVLRFCSGCIYVGNSEVRFQLMKSSFAFIEVLLLFSIAILCVLIFSAIHSILILSALSSILFLSKGK